MRRSRRSTQSNFSKLEVAWRFKTDSLGPRPEFQFESTPLMIKGVIYTTAGSRRAVVALDAATGEMLWMHSENEGARGANAPRQLSGRGLAYWAARAGVRRCADSVRDAGLPADRAQREIRRRRHQLRQQRRRRSQERRRPGDGSRHRRDRPALDADRGEERGHHRRRAQDRRQPEEPAQRERVRPRLRRADGKAPLDFPHDSAGGEFGNDTWEKDSWSYTGNTGVWGQISADEELGLVYSAGRVADRRLLRRPSSGNGLFGESLVAVDLQTGKRRWHYQLVHHGIWDMDIPCAPIPVDLVVNGRP
jgi:quinoprotein glucose dehydrogenase